MTDPGLEYTVIVATRQERGETRFLMVRHADRGWELPGGKLEEGEGPVHCALREFREETGHLLGAPRFVAKLRKPNGICHVFKGTLGAKVGDVDADEAVTGMAWFDVLPAAEELAFPDDPYEEIGQAMGIRFRSG